jgi:hypothetical protein
MIFTYHHETIKRLQRSDHNGTSIKNNNTFIYALSMLTAPLSLDVSVFVVLAVLRTHKAESQSYYLNRV